MLKLSNGWTDWHQIWQTCADSSGNGFTTNKLPFETQGALWGLGGQTCKSLEKLSNGWTDWHQLWFTSADSSGSGHRLNTGHPTITQGAFGGGGLRGSQIQMSGEAFKRLDRLAPTFGTRLRIRLGMDIAKHNSPLNSTGGIWGGGLGCHKLKSGKAAKRMDRLNRNKIRNTSVDSSGNGHRLKQFAPRYHTAALGGGGGFRGSTIQKPGKCQTAGPIGNTFCTYNAGASGNGHRLNKLAP